MTRSTAVITGVGAVSPLALDLSSHFERLVNGESAVAIAPESAPYRSAASLEARISEFNRRDLIGNRMLRKLLTRSAAYAVVAAGEALRDAGLDDQETRRRTALFGGSVCIDFDPATFIPAFRESLGPAGELDIARFATRGIHLIDPLFLVKALPNGGIGGIAIEHEITGRSLNITNGPVSGIQAIIMAASTIERGEVEVALAGGYDSLLNMDAIAEHAVADRLTTRGSSPHSAVRAFDQKRDGYVLGEGSAFVVLESAMHAARRGAKALATLAAGSFSTAGSSIRLPGAGATALASAAQQALDRAGVAAGDVGAIYGDGVATEEDDVEEAEAAVRVFGDQATLTSSTGSVGFTGAASGAFSVVHAVEGFRRGVLPPVINCEELDPRCRLDVVRERREGQIERVLVWNSANGIKNATCLLEAP